VQLPERLSRRGLLRLAALGAAGAARPAVEAAAGPPAVASGAGTGALAPAVAEGPYSAPNARTPPRVTAGGHGVREARR